MKRSRGERGFRGMWTTTLVFALALCVPSWIGAARAAEPVKIGAVIPISGPMGIFGKRAIWGMELAAETVNQGGGIKSLGGAKIQLDMKDAAMKPPVAIRETERLASEGAVVIMGHMFPPATFASSQAAEKLGVPYITPVDISDAMVQRKFKRFFMINAKASLWARSQISALKAFEKATGKSYKRVGLIHLDEQYGTASAKGQTVFLQKMGYEKVADVAYSPTSKDVTSQITRLKAANPDIVLAVSFLPDAIMIRKTMVRLGLNVPLFGTGAGYSEPLLIEKLGDLAEGILTIHGWNSDLPGGVQADMRSRFKAKYGEDMTTHSALHYQAVMVAAAALEKAGSRDRAAVARALKTLRIEPGPRLVLPQASLDFDETGYNRNATPVVYQVQGGKFVTVYPEKWAQAKPRL